MKKNVLLSVALLTLSCLAPGQAKQGKEVPYKVYVMLGFHTSFYHSWRGDSNDEAGFGTDIRVVRGILKQLDEANAKGLDARGYWDIDVYFTIEQIISKFAPDIIEGIKRRVDAGLDEVLPAPYNNGILSAHTPYELERMAKWSLENPWGTGLVQIFGKATPIIRPQEAMSTPGIIPVLNKAGIEGIILPYSFYPFTAFSNFVKPLPEEQRYNPMWLKHETGPERMVLIPCYSPGDALNFGSFELWMKYLRNLQEKGIVKSDLLLHYNFDADAETWLPMELPYGLSGLPNTGGATEIIEAVNKYDWAEFTTPAEYLKNHPPKEEVVIRQDTADGAFDGYYSWAEKYESQLIWSNIELSRMYTYRSKAFEGMMTEDERRSLWADRDSSFWYRLLSLSTTHFGMSTPIINEERQAAAAALVIKAFESANSTYNRVQLSLRNPPSGGCLYEIKAFNYPRREDKEEPPSRMAIRIPVLIPKELAPMDRLIPALKDGAGNRVNVSLINIEDDGNEYFAELTFVAAFNGNESKGYCFNVEEGSVLSPRTLEIANKEVKLAISENGAATLNFRNKTYGGTDFLEPFITYRSGKKPRVYRPASYSVEQPPYEYLDGLHRSRLVARLPFRTPDGERTAVFTYTFSLYDELPYLIVDVEADYPYTTPHDLIHTVQQKLRRLLDLRWVEVGPFAIHPDITAPESRPLKIWKHNYLGVMSSYSLDYGQINPKNREIDSFNHQITNGWVALSNGEKGLLIAQDASVKASFAFAPMRLRVKDGGQQLYMNPFGTYFGKQFDYTHLHKSKVATDFAEAIAAHMKPSGPSFNGKHESFRLLLAPYEGDAPPEQIRNDSMAFFYPYGARFDFSWEMEDTAFPEDFYFLRHMDRYAKKMDSGDPLPIVGGLLANPSDGAIDLVWDFPRDIRIQSFDVRWKAEGESFWNETRFIGERRYHIPGLNNGTKYIFSVRVEAGQEEGEWAPEVEGVPGAVSDINLTSGAGDVSMGLILRLAGKIIKHMILIH